MRNPLNVMSGTVGLLTYLFCGRHVMVTTATACLALGVNSVAVTAGYMHKEPMVEFYAHMNAANVDLKSMSNDFYVKYCGGHLQPVLDTLVYLVKQTPVWVEITTLLIPGLNDSDAKIRQMADWTLTELGPDAPLPFS